MGWSARRFERARPRDSSRPPASSRAARAAATAAMDSLGADDDLVDLSEGEVLLQLQELHRQLAERRQTAKLERDARARRPRERCVLFSARTNY